MDDEAIEYLARAIAYRVDKDLVAAGAAQGALRRDIMARPPTEHEVSAARHHFHRLMNKRIEDMPPGPDDLSLLVDTICMRRGFTARADAWRSIGISPDRGRELLARNKHAIDWPIWKTARDAAFSG
jgi:hypothetical protein